MFHHHTQLDYFIWHGVTIGFSAVDVNISLWWCQWSNRHTISQDRITVPIFLYIFTYSTYPLTNTGLQYESGRASSSGMTLQFYCLYCPVAKKETWALKIQFPLIIENTSSFWGLENKTFVKALHNQYRSD